MPDKKYIRLFKDSTPDDLWASYCEACGVPQAEEVKSFKIYYSVPGDIVVDEYDVDGNIKLAITVKSGWERKED